jgi:hypothetical protein
MKPLSIQKPSNRTIGQWVAEIQLRGKNYTPPVLHAHYFENSQHYDDRMKSKDGSNTSGRRYSEHMAALANAHNDGLVIIQKTKIDDNGTRSNAGYLGVFETTNLNFTENGYSLDRGRQVAMFSS